MSNINVTGQLVSATTCNSALVCKYGFSCSESSTGALSSSHHIPCLPNYWGWCNWWCSNGYASRASCLRCRNWCFLHLAETLRMLAIDLQDLIRKRVGNSQFETVRDGVRQRILNARRERKTAKFLKVFISFSFQAFHALFMDLIGIGTFELPKVCAGLDR